MSVHTTAYPTLIDNRTASASELAPLAFSGFAHFTAMQIRGHKAKGMDLHLARLREASLALFGKALPDENILASIRLALEQGPADMSLTVTLFVPDGEFTAASKGALPSMLVRTGPPHDGPAHPLRLQAVEHERHLASIKHVGRRRQDLISSSGVRAGMRRRGLRRPAWHAQRGVDLESRVLGRTSRGLARGGTAARHHDARQSAPTGAHGRPAAAAGDQARQRGALLGRSRHEFLDAGGSCHGHWGA